MALDKVSDTEFSVGGITALKMPQGVLLIKGDKQRGIPDPAGARLWEILGQADTEQAIVQKIREALS